MIKIYLDDLRACPEGWTPARSVAEARELLLTQNVTNISLDHDLGGACENGCYAEDQDIAERVCVKDCSCGCHKTGYDLCLWMAETGCWSLYKPTIHSANPVGRDNMQAVIDRCFPR